MHCAVHDPRQFYDLYSKRAFLDRFFHTLNPLNTFFRFINFQIFTYTQFDYTLTHTVLAGREWKS